MSTLYPHRRKRQHLPLQGLRCEPGSVAAHCEQFSSISQRCVQPIHAVQSAHKMSVPSSRKRQLNGFMALVFVSQVFLFSAHHVLFQENYILCTTHSSHSNPHIYVPKGRAVQLKEGTRGQEYAFKIDWCSFRKTKENRVYHFIKPVNPTFLTPRHTTSEKFKTHRGAMPNVRTTTRESKRDTHNLMTQVTIPTHAYNCHLRSPVTVTFVAVSIRSNIKPCAQEGTRIIQVQLCKNRYICMTL